MSVSASGYTDALPPLTVRPAGRGQHGCMFFFFSNKLGWVGSILISVALSLLLLFLFGVFG